MTFSMLTNHFCSNKRIFKNLYAQNFFPLKCFFVQYNRGFTRETISYKFKHNYSYIYFYTLDRKYDDSYLYKT